LATKFILAGLAVVFLIAAVLRLGRDRGRIGPASKTWLIIAFVFGAVSLWLWR
jgi:hypothetical protein